MTVSKITIRAKRILKLIVHNYIQTGKTTSSFALVKKYDLPWSSATVRSTMSELMDDNFVSQPHKSAGRVPTELGMRFYIDYLLSTHELPNEKRNDILNRYNAIEGTIDEVLQATSTMLCDISHCAGLATAPAAQFMKIKSAELVKLGETAVLVVFIFEGGLTEKTFVKLEKRVKYDILEKASNYLNDIAVGLTLEEVSTKVVNQIRNERKYFKLLIQKILESYNSLYKNFKTDVYIMGKTSILTVSEIDDPARLQELIKALDEKEFLAGILDNALDGGRAGVLIGGENGVMEGYSLVAAPYGSDKRLGTLGVLGPIRMNYSQIIPLVNYTASLLSKLIGEGELYR